MCSGDNFAKIIVFISMVSMAQHFDMIRVLAESRPWTDILRINGVGECNLGCSRKIVLCFSQFEFDILTDLFVCLFA